MTADKLKTITADKLNAVLAEKFNIDKDKKLGGLLSVFQSAKTLSLIPEHKKQESSDDDT